MRLIIPRSLFRPAVQWPTRTHDPDNPPPATPCVARRLAPYVLAVVVSFAVLLPGQRIRWADLKAPFCYTADAQLILPFVKATVERGSHWRNERLGFPGIQETHDFPVIDHLHFAVIWAIGCVVGDPVVAFNAYHLLTYPLTALAGLFVLRRLGLSEAAALAGGLLYAFLPYHYRRGENHYFLAAYYVVPFTLLTALEIARGNLPFFRQREGGRWGFTLWSGRTWGAIAIAAATASAGAYYAFFGCVMVAAAGLYGWAARRCWRSAAAGGLVVGVVFAGGVANHAPAIYYQYRFGVNSAPHVRSSEESEKFGLKIIQMVLPTIDHRWHVLDVIRKRYDNPYRPLLNENESANLGLVGTVGLVGLLAAAVLPVGRRWPVGPAAMLTLMAILVATVGGLGTVFAEFVSPQVRSYNRIVVYIAFLCLFAVCWRVDVFFRSRTGWVGWLRVPAFGALATFGLWDQTPKTWFTAKADDERTHFAAEYQADAAFFGEIERRNPGGAVLMVPFVSWPEQCYYHVCGYLNTSTVRWGFGAIRGREVDQWHRSLCADPVDVMLRRAVARGFNSMLVDLRQYNQWTPGPNLKDLQAALGPDTPPPLTHPDGQRFYFDLRPFHDRVRREMGTAFDDLVRAEEERVYALWLDGFETWEPHGQEWRLRWCRAKSGELVFVNPTDRPRTFRLTATFLTHQASYADLVIKGGEVWSDRLSMTAAGTPIDRVVTIPPGRHHVKFRCRPYKDFVPDGRGEVFRVTNFTMTELPPE